MAKSFFDESMGVSTRDMTDDLDGINAQASDISFLITYASPSRHGLSEVAVVSWSWGGISSLFAAARILASIAWWRWTAASAIIRASCSRPGTSSRADDHTASFLHCRKSELS